jgi:hypothetical protein
MSPLAFDIYVVLRARVHSIRPELTYDELVEGLPSPFNALDADSPILTTALEELAFACRANGLPPITMMLVKQDEDCTPPTELKKVRSSSYPPAL